MDKTGNELGSNVTGLWAIVDRAIRKKKRNIEKIQHCGVIKFLTKHGKFVQTILE